MEIKKRIIEKMISPIKKDVRNFNIFLEQNLHSDVKIINTITKYLIKNPSRVFVIVLVVHDVKTKKSSDKKTL